MKSLYCGLSGELNGSRSYRSCFLTIIRLLKTSVYGIVLSTHLHFNCGPLSKLHFVVFGCGRWSPKDELKPKSLFLLFFLTRSKPKMIPEFVPIELDTLTKYGFIKDHTLRIHIYSWQKTRPRNYTIGARPFNHLYT